MPTGDVDTYYRNKMWHNRVQGTAEVFGSSTKRGTAIWAGREKARRDGTAHAIRDRDGHIVQRHCYSERADGPSASQRLAEQRSIILGGF